ncbi:MAG: hypothetical protein WC756_03590 [Taibaiella sp.]|jgi:hypothetical protein
MKQFSDFDIEVKPEVKRFIGEKIKIKKILNILIEVQSFRIEKSNYEGKGNRLDMQIRLNGNNHVVFTGSKILMDQIQKVPPDGFPFTATIVDANDYFEFK